MDPASGQSPTPGQIPDELAAAADRAMISLLAERNGLLSAELYGEFEDAGLHPILLKGAATRALLGRPRRVSGDVDLLVGPAEFGQASALLTRLGYRRQLGSHSDTWSHPTRAQVDLHRTLTRVGTNPHQTWQILDAHRMALNVGGRDIQVLDVPAQLVHVAIHATQTKHEHGRERADLRAAADLIDEAQWQRASEVAAALQVSSSVAWALTAIGEQRLAALFGPAHLAARDLFEGSPIRFATSTTHWAERVRRLILWLPRGIPRALLGRTRRQRELAERLRKRWTR